MGTAVVCSSLLAGSLGSAQEAPASGRQLTPDDYARAERVDRRALYGKLKNALVIPGWIGQRDEFWYRREAATGAEFDIVDAATGKRRPAFDHAAVARALSAATGNAVTADGLPFTTIAFTPTMDAIHVVVGEKQYDCTLLKTVTCTGGTPAPSPGPFEITFASQVPTDKGAPNEGVIISPDGKLGVVSKGGNVWLRDMQSGQERALTTDGEGANFGYGIYPGGWKAASIARERAVAGGYVLPPMETSWSPDSRTILVPKVDQRHVADYHYLETVPGDGSFRPIPHNVRVPLLGERPPTFEWYVIDAGTGQSRRLALPYDSLLVLQQDLLAVRRTWWSTDSRHLFAVAFGYNMEWAYLFDIDVATGAARTVIEEHMLPRMDLNSTSYNPPNVWVGKDGGNIIWFSQRDGWGHLYLYDGRTGRLVNQITKGEWLVRDLIDVDEAHRRIFFTAGGREGGDPYNRYLYRVNFDGSGLTLLSPEKADHILTSPYNDVLSVDGAKGYRVVSPSGRYVVYTYSTVTEPPQSVIRSVADGRLVATVEKADASALVAAGYHPPEPFVTKGADGVTDIYGVMYKPSDFDPAKKYAVVDLEYASPLTSVVPHDYARAINGVPAQSPSSEALAEFGFVVVAIDGRGTTYRSRAFLHSTYGKLNVNGLDDHVAAIKQLGEKYPWVDATRVGIMGGSYGGWSAFRGMLEFPDFYTVGVAGSPPASQHNQYLDYHETAMQGRPVYSDGSETRPTPSEVPKNYVASDGRQQASRLKGHLMILMGELDENVMPSSTLEFVDALMRAGKDFDLVYMPNQNHVTGYVTYDKGAYTTRRIYDYFARYLMGATTPDWNREGDNPREMRGPESRPAQR
jgi:dipeptidyl aminopeptidase/acylaminoacyl peptidase